MIRDLEAVVVQLPIQSLAALPPNHDIRHLVRQILFLAAESIDRHRTPLLMSQKIVQLLYKTQSQLGREVYVALLDQLCHSFEDVAKEAITWLLYAEDEVRINSMLHVFFCLTAPSSESSTCLSPSRYCKVVL
jgi:CCR4-NOT transcription complex subunit 1